MNLKIDINLDNAAFDSDFRPEVRRILEKLAGDMEYSDLRMPGDYKNIRDINGNTIGKLIITK